MPDSVFSEEIPHDITTRLMIQLSGVGCDFYTNHVASIIFKDFLPGQLGQRRVNAALSNLPICFTPDEKLTLGWGYEHIMRNNEVHQAGYEHLALLSAIAESFHVSWGAEVCHAMAKSVAGPKDTLPHLNQWVAILRTCNGALASTDFGVTVEDFIRLGKHLPCSQQYGHSTLSLKINLVQKAPLLGELTSMIIQTNSCLDPYNLELNQVSTKNIPINTKEVVAALHALSEVVKGEQKELVLTGSPIAGWFAAVAEVLYDLDVAVFSSEGESLSGTKGGADAQIRIIYREKMGIEILSDCKAQGLSKAFSNMGITSQQYARSIHSTPLGGRVIWQSMLPRVFGTSFSHLDREYSKFFSGMVGGAARMFEGLVHNEGAEADLISAHNKCNPASYGAGLITTLTNWLPELRKFEAKMERALKLDYDKAAEAYVDNISKLRDACHCGVCYSKPGDENSGQGPEHGYCIVTLVETIIALGLALSRITVIAQIYPTRAGMQRMYASQVDKRLEARGKRWQDHFKIIFGNEWNAGNERRLQTCATLFGGSDPKIDLPANLVAIAHEGIVAYLVMLEKSAPKAEDAALIRVSSGAINFGPKVYQRAALGPVETSIEDMWEKVNIQHLKQPLYCK